MTGNDIINEALLLDGVIYPGQILSPEAAATSQFGLNMMLGEWSAQGLAVFSVLRVSFALIAGKGDYSIGPAADLATPRPEKIDAWATHSTTSGSDGGVPMDAATFATGRSRLEETAFDLGLLSAASLQGQRVKQLNYDAAYPVGNIHLYPLPSIGMTLELWVWQQFVSITDFTIPLDFPPGYLKAILYNLAVDLAPKFGREVGGTVANVANQCKAGLGATNASEHSNPAPGAQK